MTAESLFVALGVSAGVIQLIGYGLYLVLNRSSTNTGSWLIWALSAFFDLFSYEYITGGDIIKNILPAVCALACVLTFLILLYRRQFGSPDRVDWYLVVADGAISALWWLSLLDGLTANLLLQATTLTAVIPMARGLLAGVDREHLLPWQLWFTAYVLHTLSVTTRLNHWSELAYPLTTACSCLIIITIEVRMKFKAGV